MGTVHNTDKLLLLSGLIMGRVYFACGGVYQ